MKRVKLVDVKNHDITTAELKKGSVVRLFVKSTGTGQNRKDKITKIQAMEPTGLGRSKIKEIL